MCQVGLNWDFLDLWIFGMGVHLLLTHNAGKPGNVMTSPSPFVRMGRGALRWAGVIYFQ